jgi:hypothetical protein
MRRLYGGGGGTATGGERPVCARLRVVKETLRRRMHEAIDEQGAWLRRVVMGFNAYHGVRTNAGTLADFRHNVADIWRRPPKSDWKRYSF